VRQIYVDEPVQVVADEGFGIPCLRRISPEPDLQMGEGTKPVEALDEAGEGKAGKMEPGNPADSAASPAAK